MDDFYGRPAQRSRVNIGSYGGFGAVQASPSLPSYLGRPAAPASSLLTSPAGRLAQPAAAVEADEGPSATEQEPACRWLACSYKTGQLGVAAFDRMSNELSVLQVEDDNKGACAFQMLQYIKLQVNPQVIVLPATAEPALLAAAKAPTAAATGAAALDGDGSSSSGEVLLQLQRPSVFTYNTALKMLGAVSVRQQHPQQRQHPAGLPGSSSRYNSSGGCCGDFINLASQQQVAALGGLVAVLLQQQEDDVNGGEGVLCVDKLSEMTLEGHLLVDGPSLAALDVFKEEEHPSAMGIGASKEGVSVYGLLQRCVTGMGKRLLRAWFLRPVVQLDVLADRHDTLELLVAAPGTNDALRTAMKKVHDLPRLLSRLRLSLARPQLTTFKQLADSINQLLALRQVIAALAPATAAGKEAAGSGAGADGMPGQQGEQQTPRASSREGLPSWLQLDGEYDNDGLGFDAAAAVQAAPPAAVVIPSAWDKVNVTNKLLSSIGQQLAACGALIGDVLDLSCPPVEGCLVQAGVCDALDELKATHQQLPELLTQVVERELRRVPAHVARRYSKQLWSVVYIPQVGFVMSVTGGKLSEELVDLLPDYQLAFMGEDGPAGAPAAAAADGGSSADPTAGVLGGEQLDSRCAYYYADCTQQLNSQYGDLQHKIQDLEASICTELIKRLLSFSPCLTAAAAAMAELDCLCSFAAAARELGYSRPALTTENVLIIEGGRHPLTELLAEGRFIPNDTRLGAPPPTASAAAEDGGGEQQQEHVDAGRGGDGEAAAGSGPRMLLITGPNASGKSVYMKQVALLVYLAHVGSFIPAQRALIGITDRILTRLPGMEAVGQHTSSFMADLGQVSTILNRATPRSLVLLDEFGKGTMTSDGVGLLAAMLQHYASQPCPPKLLACTHFNELLDPAVLPDHPQLQLCTMQVLVSGRAAGAAVEAEGTAAAAAAGAAAAAAGEAAGQHEEEHVFLYKLVQGHVAPSYGLNCARMCGVDSAILLRASDVMALQQAGQPVSRLALPQLEQRDQQYWQLVEQLAGLDLSSGASVKGLLQAMLDVEAAAA